MASPAHDAATPINTLTRFMLEYLQQHPGIARHALRKRNITGFRRRVLIFIHPWQRSQDPTHRQIAASVQDVDWYEVRRRVAFQFQDQPSTPNLGGGPP